MLRIVCLCIIFAACLALDGVWDFDLKWHGIHRAMRAYLCSDGDLLRVALTDPAPLNGFSEFPVGLAVFDNDDPLQSKHGVYLRDPGVFVDAQYVLQSSPNTALSVTFSDDDGADPQTQFTLERTDIVIAETDRASKCWMPHQNEEGNIERVLSKGRSIWMTEQLPEMTVHDLDILNDTGHGDGCWGWVDRQGIAAAAEHIGTAGGANFNYRFMFEGDLLLVDWDDHGSWIDEATEHCHRGSSLFMITAKDTAAATFTCSDQVTGSQMIMRRQTNSDLKCPLLSEDKSEL